MAIRTGIRLKDLTEQEVIELQQLLIKLGYNPGPVDGSLGPLTEQAYARFLKANGNGDPTLVDAGVSLLAQGEPEAWAKIVPGTEMTAPSTPKPYQATPGVSGVPRATTPTPAPTSAAQAPTTPYAPPPQGAVDEQVRKLYPNLAYYLDNPEIGQILRDAAQNGWDAARLQGALFQTTWWQTTSANARQWDLLNSQDPAEATRRVDAKMVEIMNLAMRYGVSIDEQGGRWLSGKILREGWTDDQLLRFLGQTARGVGIVPGKISNEAAKIQDLAKKYMVKLNEKDATEWATRVFEGTASMDTVESYFRLEAKNRFHWLGDQIDSGITPDQMFGTLRNVISQTLEIDPAQIDFNDARWAAITNPVLENSGTGKFRTMNYNEAMQWARSQPEWTRTKAAQDESSQLGLSLLRALGAVK